MAGDPELGQNFPVWYSLYGGNSVGFNGIKEYQWSVSGGELFPEVNAVSTNSLGSTYTTSDANPIFWKVNVGGHYTTKLIVLDHNAQTNETTEGVIAKQRPSAIAIISPIDSTEPDNSPIKVGQSVMLDGTKSNDQDGKITGYHWLVSSSAGQVIVDNNHAFTTMAFPAADTYTITLTVTDNNGLATTKQQPLTVGGNPPTAVAKIVLPSGQKVATLSEAVPLTAKLNGTESQGNNLKCKWSSPNQVPKEGCETTMDFLVAGNHSVTMTVTDEYNQMAQDEVTVIAEIPPTLDAMATPSTACQEMPKVSLEAKWTPKEPNKVISYQWTDTNTEHQIATGKKNQALFLEEGTYPITLVADYVGYNFQQKKTISVTVTKPEPKADIVVKHPESNEEMELPIKVNVGETLILDGSQSTLGNPYCQFDKYKWEIEYPNGSTKNIRIGESIRVTFPEEGMYRITLTVTDNVGVSNSHLILVNAGSDPCQVLEAVAEVEPRSGILSEGESMTVTLDASKSQAHQDCPIVQYEWTACLKGQSSCDDKVVSGQEEQAKMTFDSGGEYEITLSVTNQGEMTDKSQPVKISFNEPPKACFTATPIFSNLPITVAVDADCSSDDSPIRQYEWTTVEHSSQTSSKPTDELVFDKEGNYTITLTVTDDQETTDTTEREVLIDELNNTVRVGPQVLAAGASPIQLDLADDRFDIIAWVRPGVAPIRNVSFQDTKAFLQRGMTRIGVFPNGDEIYKSTFTYTPGDIEGIIEAPWGSKEGQFNIVATDEAQDRGRHIFPHLMVGNFPKLAHKATPPKTTIKYDTRARFMPQVIMAGYSPAILDIGDDELDVFAIVRAGNLPIKRVVMKQNENELFYALMDFIGELDNGDKVYKLTYTYERGSLNPPEGLNVIAYKDLWGPDAHQFVIEIVDESERRHKFPYVEFGDHPALDE